MNLHIGKAILKELKESGISNAEFARRINKAPSTIPDIFKRESIDTKLLLDISVVLKYNFFALYMENKQLGGLAGSKDKVSKLIAQNEDLAKANISLNNTLKRLITLLEKKPSVKKVKK